MSKNYLETALALRRGVLGGIKHLTDRTQCQLNRLEENSKDQSKDYNEKAFYAYLAGVFCFSLQVASAYFGDTPLSKGLNNAAKGIEVVERARSTSLDGRLAQKHTKQQLLQDALNVSREEWRRHSDEGRDLLEQIRRSDETMARAREIKG